MRIVICLFLLFSESIVYAQSTTALQAKFDSLYKINEINTAIPFGEAIVEYGLKNGVTDTVIFSRSLIRLLNCYNSSRMPEKSETIIPVAFQYTLPNTLGHAVLMKSTADWIAYTFRPQLADSVFEAALAEYKHLGKDKTQLGFQCLSSAVDNKLSLGFLDEAEMLLSEALACFESTGTIPDENMLFAMGRLMMIQGRHTKALPYFEKSISLLSKKYPPSASNLVYKKNVYIPLLAQEGFYFKADSLLQQLLQDVEDASGTRSYDYLYTLRTYGILRNNLGDFKTAEKYFLQACDIAGVLGEKSDKRYLDIAVYLANNYIAQGKMEEASVLVMSIRDAFYSQKKIDAPGEGDLFSLLAACSKSTAEEVDYLQKAVAVFQKYSGKAWCGNQANEVINLVKALLKDHRYTEAMNYLNQMSEIEGEIVETDVIFTEYLYYKGIAATYTRDREMALSCWNRIASIQSKGFFESVFFLNESARTNRLNYLNNISGTLMSLARQYPFLNEPAIHLQLLNKSLLLSTDQKIRANIQNDSTLAPVFEEWTDARERLAWCYSQAKTDLIAQRINVAATETRTDSLEKILSRQSAVFATSGLKQVVKWQEIQKKLLPGQAAVDIARFEQYDFSKPDTVRYAFLVITPDMTQQPALVFLDNGDQLEDILLEQYLDACISPKGSGNTDQLYRTVWEPLAPYLQGSKTIFIAADGIFHKINLSALQRSDGSFLADEYDIRPVFSLKDINKIAVPPTQQGKKNALLVGNPAFKNINDDLGAVTRSVTTNDPYQSETVSPMDNVLHEINTTRSINLDPLPGSEAEVKVIAGLLQQQGFSVTVLIHRDATEAAVKSAKSPAVIHVATHGYFLANEKSGITGLDRENVVKNPMLRSMLFFAGAQNSLDKKTAGYQKEDGILTAYELQNMQLEYTELVVLSACKTAQGKVLNGEGVFGLQRALRIAGAQALMLSLWDVDDKVGNQFMKMFYNNWLSGQTKADAYRSAQAAIKKKYPQPFYWAGFVLME